MTSFSKLLSLGSQYHLFRRDGAVTQRISSGSQVAVEVVVVVVEVVVAVVNMVMEVDVVKSITELVVVSSSVVLGETDFSSEASDR
jgi:ABC-type transport system involved in Fe-S cluster assembly fused permease/ATPase subunit